MKATTNIPTIGKESWDDYVGWKAIIFLPFKPIWQHVIVMSTTTLFFLCTYRFAYLDHDTSLFGIIYICDALYLFDLICALLHYNMPHTRKLKNWLPRPWYLLSIDIFSVIPFELAYATLVVDKSQHWNRIGFILFMNRCLRLYRLYLYFVEVKLHLQNMQIYVLVGFIEITLYEYVASHLFSCVWHVVGTDDEDAECSQNRVACVMENEFNFMYLIVHHFIGSVKTTNSTARRFIIVLTIFIGYICMYAVAMPFLIFTYLKFLRPYFDFSIRYSRLKTIVDNVIESKNLRTKALRHFRSVWTHGTGEREPKIMATLPLCFRKNIHADMHWEAMRHSELIKGTSRSFKRALALCMVTEFVMPDVSILEVGEVKTKMIYLAAGMLQVMAEENQESPVLSFSPGSVLCEVSCIVQTQSKAILRSAAFSEIHVLRYVDLFRTLVDYPRDRKLVFKKIYMRLKFAKMAQFRKNTMCKELVSDHVGFFAENQDAVKWIKEQYRALADIHRQDMMMIKARQEGTAVAILRQRHRLTTGLDHISNYLELLALSDAVEVKTDVVCLHTNLPWIIEPSCHFLAHWNRVIFLLVLYAAVAYPFYIGWFLQLPDWFFYSTILITACYIIDVCLQATTAEKTKEVLIDHFWRILRFRLGNVKFYVDIVSALPLQVFFVISTGQDNLLDHHLGLYCANSLFKVYRIVLCCNDWMKNLNTNTAVVCMIKYIFLLCLLVYFTAAILQLTGVACVFYECESGDWYETFLEESGQSFADIASVFFAMVIGLDLPATNFYAGSFTSAIMVMLISIIFLFFSFMWYGEFIATYISEKSYEMQFKSLIDVITNFMNGNNLSDRLKNRVLKTMKFHWSYDFGDYLTQRSTMLQEAPPKLRWEIDHDSIYKTIKHCDFFKVESEEFIRDLTKIAERLALPAGSVVVTFGTQTMKLYLIHKGFCQINSFLPKDVRGGVGASIISRTGGVFPVIVALNQIPSAVTAVTLTDCELIVLRLEDLLKVMVRHGTFKDTVNAAKETDLTSLINARLGLSKVKNSHRVDTEANYLNPFKKFTFFGLVLRLLLFKNTIDPQGKVYTAWELSRVVFLTIGVIVWPMTFAMLMSPYRDTIQYALYGMDALAFIDFYVRMHVRYFNKKGILVSHPLFTAVHYLTSSFLIDAITVFPFVWVYKLTTGNPGLVVNNYMLVFPSAFKLLGLYRLYGFLRYYEELSESAYKLRLLKHIITSMSLLNCFVNIKCRLDATWEELPNGDFSFTLNSDAEWLQSLNLDKPVELYITTLYGTLVTIFGNEFYYTGWKLDALITNIFLTLIGWMSTILIFAFSTSRAKSSNTNFTVYQYRMQSFVSFLNSEKTDDSIANKAIEHIEHEWEKRQGEELEKIFLRFPNILHEDLTYPIYKSTISAVHCLAEANEAFYRQLCRYAVPVYFKKGTTIVFKNQVQNSLYFVRSGQCLVKTPNVMLYRGSLFGDIRRTGIMTNKIVASTHVDLLKISSDNFFTIMNNFYKTERSFMESIQNVDDYVESEYIFVSLKKTKTDDDDNGEKKNDKEQSKFEVIYNKTFVVALDQNSAADYNGQAQRKHRFFIHPESSKCQAWNWVLLIDAYLTVVLLPLFITLRSLLWSIFIFIHALDLIWILKIVLSLYTAYIDHVTGNLVTGRMAIFKRYAKRIDGFFVDFLTVIPFELIQYLYGFITDKKLDYVLFQYGLVFRLLRIFYVYSFFSEQSKKLSVSYFVRWMMVLCSQILVVNSFVAIYMLIATEEGPTLSRYYTEWTMEQTDALIWSYLYVCNIFTGTGLTTFRPSNIIQMVFISVVALVAILEKAILINQVLSIVNVAYHNKSEYMHNLQLLEKYLTVRDVSPALVSSVREYGYDLLALYRAEAMPWFLVRAPDSIKVSIMNDLYVYHLSECYLFEGLSIDFLKQLATRLERHIYFPGEKIVEKGDVDYNMYFIHRGEVVCLEMDPVYPSLELVVDVYNSDEYFGQPQGVWKSTPHNNTYRAKTIVELLSLNFHNWSDLRRCFPQVTQRVYEKARASDEIKVRTRSESV